MNTSQKLVVAAGVILAAVRAAFPVKYAGLPELRFDGGFPGIVARTDWKATGLHIALIAIVTTVLAFLFKKK